MTEITTVAQQNMLRAITRVLLAHSWNVDNGCDAGCSGIGTAEGWRHHIAVALLTEINPAQPTVQPSVEAEVKAQAWDEGCRAAEQFYKVTVLGQGKAIPAPMNPYRTGTDHG